MGTPGPIDHVAALLTVATGLGPLVVSAAVACIAAAQWVLARQKLRLDLYDRRFGIYNSALLFYSTLISWSGSDQDRAVQRQFFEALQASRFLFSNKSGIFELYDELHREAFKVIGPKDHREAFSGDPEISRAMFEASNHVLLTLFPQSLDKIRKRIGPYLDFHRV